MKSYPSADSGKVQSSSPFLDTEQWEKEDVGEERDTLLEPESPFLTGKSIDEFRYDDEMEDFFDEESSQEYFKEDEFEQDIAGEVIESESVESDFDTDEDYRNEEDEAYKFSEGQLDINEAEEFTIDEEFEEEIEYEVDDSSEIEKICPVCSSELEESEMGGYCPSCSREVAELEFERDSDGFDGELFEQELGGSALASAVDYNRKKAKSVGWYEHFDAIVASILKLNYSPGEEAFAQEVAEWQGRNGLDDDGKIGPGTWKKMRAILGLSSKAPSKSSKIGPLSVIDVRMPDPTGGEYRLKAASRNRGRQYGIDQTIRAILWTAQQWHKRHPEILIGIGDISYKGGGQISPHTSHRMGLDVDLALFERATNKRISKTKVNKKYRPIVREFLDLVVSNPVAGVKTIFYFDHSLSSKIKNSKSSADHWRHLHIRFCRPLELKTALDRRKVKTSANYDCPLKLPAGELRPVNMNERAVQRFEFNGPTNAVQIDEEFPRAKLPKWSIHDFIAHRTELIPLHRKQLSDIAKTISKSIGTRGKFQWCVGLIGHASTWRGLSASQYDERALLRAKSAAEQLAVVLATFGLVTKIYHESKFDPMIGCEPDAGIDVTLYYGGRADLEPLKPNLAHRSDSTARANRAFNRRVEVHAKISVPQKPCTPPVIPDYDAALDSKLKRAEERLRDGLPWNKNAYCLVKKLLNPRVDDYYIGKSGVDSFLRSRVGTGKDFIDFFIEARTVLKSRLRFKWNRCESVSTKIFIAFVNDIANDMKEGINIAHFKFTGTDIYDPRKNEVKRTYRSSVKSSRSLYSCKFAVDLYNKSIAKIP